jgi:hypothetical protein
LHCRFIRGIVLCMTITGKVLNGTIKLPPGTELPEGAELQIILREPVSSADRQHSLYDTLRELVGAAQGLPPDLADEHDHYIHGAPRRVPS